MRPITAYRKTIKDTYSLLTTQISTPAAPSNFESKDATLPPPSSSKHHTSVGRHPKEVSLDKKISGVKIGFCIFYFLIVLNIRTAQSELHPKVQTATIVADASECPNSRSVAVNSVTGKVYVACLDGNSGDGRVIIIDGGTITTIATASQCPRPLNVFIDSTTAPKKQSSPDNNEHLDTLYAICYGNSEVIRITDLTYATASQRSVLLQRSKQQSDTDDVAITTVTTASQCKNPYGILVVSDTGKNQNSENQDETIYLTCDGDANTGSVISITGGAAEVITAMATTSQCSRPRSISVNYVADSYQYDTLKLREVIYVACSGSTSSQGSVIRIGSASNPSLPVLLPLQGGNREVSVLATASSCLYSQSVSVNSVTGIIYAVCEGNGNRVSLQGTVVRIDDTSNPASIRVLTTTSQCSNPTSMFVVASTKSCMVYVVCSGIGPQNAAVIQIDDGDPQIPIVTTIVTRSQCPEPLGISVNSATGVVYVVCTDIGVIAVTSQFNCPPGYYWDSTICSLCPPGSFHGNTISSPTGCDICPSGSVAVTSGSTFCTVCPAGKYSFSSEVECLDCTPGSYSSVAGSTSCFPCLAGYHGSSSGLTSSTCEGLCPAGYWCPEGSSSNVSLPCDSYSIYCPAGSFQPILVPRGSCATDCIISRPPSQCSSYAECLAGTYCDDGIQKICIGGSVSKAGRSKCDLCDAGKYQAFAAKSACILCPSGTFQPQIGSLSCIACPTHLFSQGEGNVQCSACAGNSVINWNKTGCIYHPNCSAGYGFNETTDTCDLCDIGTYNDGGSVRCRPAPVNTYVHLRGSFIPFVCPTGTRCSYGLAFSQEGYWIYVDDFSTGEIKVLPCLEGACVGGTVYGNQCAENRLQGPSNILCGFCAEGFSSEEGKCYPCTSPNGNLIFLGILISTTFVGVIHYLSRTVDSISLSIFFYFVSTTLIMCGDTTRMAGTYLRWFNIFNFRLLRVFDSCILPLDPYQVFIADIAVVFLYFAELILILIVHRCLSYCFQDKIRRKDVSRFRGVLIFDGKRYISTFAVLYLGSFSTIVTLSFQYMYCLDIGNKSGSSWLYPGHVASVLYWNPAVECTDLRYKQLLIFASVLLTTVTCLVPGIAGFYLYYYRNIVSPNTNLFWRKDDALQRSFLLNLFYYQVFILGLLLIGSILATALVVYPTQRYFCFTLLHAFLFIIHYRNDKSEIHMMGKISFSFLTFLSCFLLVFPSPLSANMKFTVLISYIVPFILLSSGVIKIHLRNVAKMREDRVKRRDSRKDSIKVV